MWVFAWFQSSETELGAMTAHREYSLTFLRSAPFGSTFFAAQNGEMANGGIRPGMYLLITTIPWNLKELKIVFIHVARPCPAQTLEKLQQFGSGYSRRSVRRLLRLRIGSGYDCENRKPARRQGTMRRRDGEIHIRVQLAHLVFKRGGKYVGP